MLLVNKDHKGSMERFVGLLLDDETELLTQSIGLHLMLWFFLPCKSPETLREVPRALLPYDGLAVNQLGGAKLATITVTNDGFQGVVHRL